VAVNGDDILEFPISTTNGSIQTGEPKVLFSTAIGQTLLFDVGWDVAPDGRLSLTVWENHGREAVRSCWW
jgi:hypothetical protein